MKNDGVSKHSNANVEDVFVSTTLQSTFEKLLLNDFESYLKMKYANQFKDGNSTKLANGKTFNSDSNTNGTALLRNYLKSNTRPKLELSSSGNLKRQLDNNIKAYNNTFSTNDNLSESTLLPEATRTVISDINNVLPESTLMPEATRRVISDFNDVHPESTLLPESTRTVISDIEDVPESTLLPEATRKIISDINDGLSETTLLPEATRTVISDINDVLPESTLLPEATRAVTSDTTNDDIKISTFMPENTRLYTFVKNEDDNVNTNETTSAKDNNDNENNDWNTDESKSEPTSEIFESENDYNKLKTTKSPFETSSKEINYVENTNSYENEVSNGNNSRGILEHNNANAYYNNNENITSTQNQLIVQMKVEISNDNFTSGNETAYKNDKMRKFYS
ncbi:uncharacterized protein DDB_G0288805-like [Uloborus diversus]|uniref:uncharacterized protein DDB_G0288805-like n=1 Tax=Uloborus diversus TaxID=327109 RepID=UPI00240A1F86|nr:uncharacterized protein DDB_G0288805-like [Uloborus diversus]